MSTKNKTRANKASVWLLCLGLMLCACLASFAGFAAGPKGLTASAAEGGAITMPEETHYEFTITKEESNYKAEGDLTIAPAGEISTLIANIDAKVREAAAAADPVITNPVKKLTFAGAAGAPLDTGDVGCLLSSGTYIIDGKITGTDYGVLWLESDTSVCIESAEISATTPSGRAIYNNGTGAINIFGGKVSAEGGYAIYNSSTGAVNISGGTVSANTGSAICNNSTGKITVSGDAVITSANTTNEQGTITLSKGENGKTILEITGGRVENNASSGDTVRTIRNNGTGNILISGGTVTTARICAIFNDAAGKIEITGGTVENTVTGGAIYNWSTGTIDISGGTVSANTGAAIFNYTSSAGPITVSQAEGAETLITSKSTSTSSGAIYLQSPNTSLTISGGTVENTSSAAAVSRALGCNAPIEITGGTLKADTGCAIRDSGTGKITVSGDAVITSANLDQLYGTVYLSENTTVETALEIKGGKIENKAVAQAANAIFNKGAGNITMSGGEVSIAAGFAIRNGSTGGVNISGGEVKTTGNTGVAIRNESTGKITISETDGENNPTLITSISGGTSGKTIHLNNPSPALTAHTVLLEITGGTVENTSSGATGAIYNEAALGDIKISGGEVSAPSAGSAVYNSSTGDVYISGGEVTANSGFAITNNSTGSINISGGTVESMSRGAINNGSKGKIKISETDSENNPTVLTSEVTIATYGTILLGTATFSTHTALLEITGGTVENTAGGYAIYNNVTLGDVVVSGGTVSADTGAAIYNNKTGAITVNGTALVTSNNAGAESGTVYLNDAGGALNYIEENITNTAAGGKIVYNPNGATVTLLCKHNYEAGTPVPPACTEGGYTTYTCSVCDDHYDDDFTDALGRNEESHSARAATCTAIGWGAYVTCSRCEYTTYSEIAALGHSEESHSARAATCTAIGWDAYVTCSRCEYTTYSEIAALGHDFTKEVVSAETRRSAANCTEAATYWYSCSVCDEVSDTLHFSNGDALGHDEESHEAKAATCTGIGWDAYVTCSRCEYTTYSEIAALGHDFTKEVVSVDTLRSAATCTEAATYWYSCEDCDEISDTLHFSNGSALGHGYGNWSVTTAPTTAATGVITRTCSHVSSHTETQTLPKLDASNYTYTVTKAATTEEAGEGKYTWNVTAYGTFSFTVAIPKIPVYDVTQGAGGTVKVGNDGGYTFKVDGDYSKFDYLEINGTTLIKDTDYTVSAGSTIITITKAGLNKLGTGSHDIKVYFTDGAIVSTTLTIIKKGLSGGAIAGIVIACIIVAVLGGFCVFWFIIKKKKFADLIEVFKKSNKV